MVVAISADLQDSWPPRMQVTVTGLTLGDDVVLTAIDNGVRRLLRGGLVSDVTDTSVIRIDAELPFAVPVRYEARVGFGSTVLTDPQTVTLPGGKVALTDAITGLAAEVVILAWPERTRDRDAAVYRVENSEGRQRSVVVSRGLGQRAGAAELFTETTAAAESLETLLEQCTQGVFQVRQPGGYDRVDGYFVALQAAERRFSQDGTDQRRTWALQLQEVDGWSDDLEASGYTLQDLADLYAGQTLADLATDYTGQTLLDLAQADLQP